MNCCAEIQALLDCPPIGPCRGIEANCGDLAEAFADTPVLPDYPDGMADYTCSAFPDEENDRDTLIVGLLAFAISLPVTLFLQTCFELANDNEAPESWLTWAGNSRLILGGQAHRRWHYTGPKGQPSRYVRWFVRSVDAPKFETLLNLLFSLKAFVTRTQTPWAEEAAEWEAEQAAQAARDERAAEGDLATTVVLEPADGPAAAQAPGEGLAAEGEFMYSGFRFTSAPVELDEPDADARTVSTSFRSAKNLRFSKRKLTAFGIGGVYLIWAFFSWVVFTYGMLIYKLLGPSTQDAFATSFGVSYAIGAAAEWQVRSSTMLSCCLRFALTRRCRPQDIVKEAAQALLIMAILERLHITASMSWLEEHIDYMSTQALLFQHTGLNFYQQTKLFTSYSKRVTD